MRQICVDHGNNVHMCVGAMLTIGAPQHVLHGHETICCHFRACPVNRKAREGGSVRDQGFRLTI
eukprot:3070836-Rhodomonas_salina.2